MECTNSHKIYKARSGAPFKKEEAQELGEEITRIRENCGGDFKVLVALKEAKKQNNPFHKHLQWDDSKCGVEFRIQQIRNITNHIVEDILISGTIEEVRSFVAVINEEGDTVYTGIIDAIETPSYNKQGYDRAMSTLKNLYITLELYRPKNCY